MEPPYDLQWTSSPFNNADRNAGTFTARAVDSLGYEAAGLGVFVSSNLEGKAKFSADAEFHSKWSDLVMAGCADSEGGVGVIVYEGGNAIARHDAQLWSDSQCGWSGIGGKSGDDSTYLTQTAAGQTYFHMVPGRQYQIWVWCWVSTAIYGSSLAVGSIEAQMPFVVVEQPL